MDNFFNWQYKLLRVRILKPLFDFSKRNYGAYKYCDSLVHSQQQTFKLKNIKAPAGTVV